MKKLSFVAVASLFCTSMAFAGGYGAAGCGLGSVVFGSSGGLVQVLAATTNATFGSQTFGITTGTSNCGGGGTSPTSVQYIEANKVSLSNDIARGNGEVINGLAEMMGCASKADFAKALQSKYTNIYPTQKVEAKTIDQSIRNIIKSNTALKSSCSLG